MATFPKILIPVLPALMILPVLAQVPNDDDNASRSVYDDGIQLFDDGSTNANSLGGWLFGGAIDVGADFIVSSGSANGGSGLIDTGGEAFLLTDSDNEGFTDVFRNLDGGSLGVGQTFSLQMDVNFRDGFKGINVRDSSDSRIFNFESSTNVDGSGTDGYTVNESTSGGGTLTTDYSNDTIFSISLTQTSLAGGDWSIVRSGGLSGSWSGTYGGQVDDFQLFTTGAGTLAENAVIFNNFEVIPEPGTLALAGIAGLVLAVSRIRRRV